MATRKSPEEKIEELRKKRDQITARIQRETAKAQSQKRKDDTRRKIIAGAIALEHAQQDQAFRETMTALLRTHVRESDQALFDLS